VRLTSLEFRPELIIRILCDDEVFDITNRWRATRGEVAIPKADNPIMRGDYGSQGMFGQPQ
jgi:hypothetical protein